MMPASSAEMLTPMSRIQMLNALSKPSWRIVELHSFLRNRQFDGRQPGWHYCPAGTAQLTRHVLRRLLSLPSPADSATLSLPFYAGTITYLVRNGANLKLADERGETALGLALKLGQKDIATP